MHKRASRGAALLLLGALFMGACQQIDDDRIPSMPVNISLTSQGVWATYGVSGFGEWRRFIIASGLREPANFPYTQGSTTGYGGVLLIGGQNPFTGEIGPLAFDLSCPYERMPDVRVNVDPANYDAVCPDCGSRYNVIEAGGSPISGPSKQLGYAMKMYSCYPTVDGGYLITNY